MHRFSRVLRRRKQLVFSTLLSVSVLLAADAQASDCANAGHFSPCFDANALWLPAGRASFISMPDTRLIEPGQIGVGAAMELLHQPVLLRAASPDRDGRDIEVLDHALDVSYFVSFGLLRHFETSLLASLRASQSGAGAGGISSQSAPPLEHNAVRDPRVGIAYSPDDAQLTSGFGLRLALDATVPLGERNPFANERSFVVMPNATLGFRHGALRLHTELGARVRRAVDFGGVSLGNQAFVALGAALEVLPAWLTVSAEAFGLPPLSDSHGSAAGPRVTDVRLFPAEWLAGLHSSFGQGGSWTLSLAVGGGLPLSSETRASSAGPQTSYFLGMTTPDFRSLLIARFAPAPPSARK